MERTPIQINMTMTLMELMNDASAVSCKLDEFETRTGGDKIVTAKPIVSPCVKHEIEGLLLSLCLNA